jgi:carboxyl-terminal processing protease
MKIKSIVWIAISAFIFSSCEKESSDLIIPARPQVGVDGDPVDAYDYLQHSSEGKLRDSVHYFTNYFYLWQNQLPQNFNPHIFRTADQVLAELKKYAKKPNGQLIDRYSFLDRQGTIRQETVEGISGSFGFDVRYYSEHELFVKIVDEGSPAYQSGLRRGWQIVEINGRRELSLQSMENDNYEFLFNALYESSTIQLRVKNPEGQERSLVLQRGSYPIRPILAHQIFDLPGQKIGYLAFNLFVSTQTVRTQLLTIMNNFAAAGVTKLIVDLRYNSGGDVSTADYLSNLIAPTSANNSLMNDYIINRSLMLDGYHLFLFRPNYYNKTNALNPNRIYFLVTGSTASASELLINNLTPYVDVKLVGDGNTYGKPVGYFGWNIMGVDLYAVSFQTVNANNFGDFYDGMEVDFYAKDGLNVDFGDPTENMTAAALHHIQHGTFPPATGPLLMDNSNKRMAAPDRKDLNYKLDRRGIKDMFIFGKN